jgi:hypothetical protein
MRSTGRWLVGHAEYVMRKAKRQKPAPATNGDGLADHHAKSEVSMKLYTPEQLNAMSVENLETLKQRFEERGVTDREDYPLILQALARKKHVLEDYDHKLTIRGVIRVLEDTARKGKTITYKEITEQLGCNEFPRYRWPLRNMLDDIFHDCVLKGEPVLTAVVIPKDGLTPEVAKGFGEAARRCGIAVTDREQFFWDEQKRVFNSYTE